MTFVDRNFFLSLSDPNPVGSSSSANEQNILLQAFLDIIHLNNFPYASFRFYKSILYVVFFCMLKFRSNGLLLTFECRCGSNWNWNLP